MYHARNQGIQKMSKLFENEISVTFFYKSIDNCHAKGCDKDGSKNRGIGIQKIPKMSNFWDLFFW
jgi:hypothetical protein